MYRTLCIIVLFAFSASAMTVREPDAIDPILKKCAAKHGVTDQFLESVRINPEALLKNHKTRCFAACVLTENESLKADGTLNAEGLIKYLPQNLANRDQIIEALNSCANEKGADTCETAYKTVMCVNGKEAILNMRPAQ